MQRRCQMPTCHGRQKDAPPTRCAVSGRVTWGGAEPTPTAPRPLVPILLRAHEAKLVRQWWTIGAPHPLVSLRDSRPHPLLAGLQRLPSIGRGTENHKLMRNDPASGVPAALRIRKAQPDSPCHWDPRAGLVLEVGEDTFVLREWIRQSTIEQEAESPRSPACGPKEPTGRCVALTHLWLLISSLLLTPRSRSILNCDSVPVR